MADDTPQGGDAATEPRPCPPCRGSGTVISNLGGSPRSVPCPWCDGTGRFIPGHDAQAARRGGEGGPGADGGAAGDGS